MRTVGELQDELKRFHPNARLSDEIEVVGISPVTECTLNLSEVNRLSSRIEWLESELGDSENECNELERKIEERDWVIKQKIPEILKALGDIDRVIGR